ncbi:casein kinase 1 [Nematocida major]|uniref:casein kinase 1 n=1 Tax=Nematocida major TaxID=1912982 RepID=UPI00200769A8|nr:casein kinase 1 [Nematocida major]KAH9387158.1 casein kinase 1 [Nematocida major]
MANIQESMKQKESANLEDAPNTPTLRKARAEYKLPQPGDIIGGYVLSEKIGQGSFGIVFEGRGVDSTRKLAIKIEMHSENRYSQLENEYNVYMKLGAAEGFPYIECFGQCRFYKYLAMEYLGMSLEDMLAIRNRMFSVKTVYIIAKRMVDQVQKLHAIGYVHRDLKPDNFLIGRDPRKIFLIDLGMAKEFVKHGQHSYNGTGKKLTGTPRYASVNAHKGYDLGRKDDLESIGYIILYLLKGKLPWQGLKESKREKCRIIGEMKSEMKIEEVAKNMPGGKQMVEYFRYVETVKFDTVPDYKYLMGLFDSALSAHGLSDDGVFEWEHVFKGYTENISNDSLDEEVVKKKSVWRSLKRLFCCGLFCTR